MPFIGPIEVTLESDDSPLEEYAVKTIANETKVACHVPSQVGKNFAICIRQLEPPLEGYKRMAEVIVDGKRTNKTILHAHCVTRIAGYRVKKDLRRPFIFAALPASNPNSGGPLPSQDVDPSLPQAQPGENPGPQESSTSHLLHAKHRILPLSSIGTIKILIAAVKLKPKPENPRRKFQPRAGMGTTEFLTDVASLPDLSVVGVHGEVHYTELDEGVNVNHAGGIVAEVATLFPILQFDYRYAPLEVLRSEGITRFMREAPFSGISLLPTARQPGEGMGKAGEWAFDVDAGSELLDEKDRIRYRELKLEIAAKRRLRDMKVR